MSAFSELSSGTIGVETVQLIYNTVGAVARLHHYPPPEGCSDWDEDAVCEVSHDFVTERMGKLIQLGAQASDDASLKRLMDETIKNFLADQARTTDRGRIARSITGRLKKMPSVASLTGDGASRLWLIEGGDPHGVAPGIDTLIKESLTLTGLATPDVIDGSQRGSALIDPQSLEVVLSHTLEFANCPLDTRTLVDVVVARFPTLLQPADSSFCAGPDLTTAHEPTDPFVITEEAVAIWEQLNEQDRLVMGPLLDAPASTSVRQLARDIGLSKTTLQRCVIRIRGIVADAQSHGMSAGVLAELSERSWNLQRGTIAGGSSSTPDTGAPT